MKPWTDGTTQWVALPFLALSLGAASLACRLNLGGPERLPSPPEPSNAAATEIAQSWTNALTGAVVTGRLEVILTEEQLTSALSARLAGDENPFLQSPTVYLRDGTIQIYGLVQEGMIEASLRLVITPVLDSEGRLGFVLTSADFGPVPAPEGLRASLSGMLSEFLAGPMGTLATGIRVTSVAVADGELAIVAELR